MSFVGKNASSNRSTATECQASTRISISCEIVYERLNPALTGRESSMGRERILAPSTNRVPPPPAQDDSPRLPQIVPRKKLSKSSVGKVVDDGAKTSMPPPSAPPPPLTIRAVSNPSENNRRVYEIKSHTGGKDTLLICGLHYIFN